jgi:hypothetical protein
MKFIVFWDTFFCTKRYQCFGGKFCLPWSKCPDWFTHLNLSHCPLFLIMDQFSGLQTGVCEDILQNHLNLEAALILTFKKFVPELRCWHARN